MYTDDDNSSSSHEPEFVATEGGFFHSTEEARKWISGILH